MTNPKPLRVVAAGETKPKPAKPLTLLQAIAAGDYLAELHALRGCIAAAIIDRSTLPRDLAALTRRQMEISREIQSLEATDPSRDPSATVVDAVFDPESV